MTISSTTNRASFTGNGVTTSFSFPYFVIAAADLKVYLNGTLQTITTDYTLSGSAPYTSGTNVQFVSAPAADDEIVVIRDPAITQAVDLVDNDPFDPDDAVERPLDKLTMIAQRLADRLDRAMVLSDDETGSPDMTLPSLADRANMALYFNSEGEPIAADVSAETVTFSPDIQLFSGDGSDTTFTLAEAPGSAAALIVTIGGVVQKPETDFTVSGTTLTFTAAPASGTSNIAVQNFGIARAVDTMDADAVTYTPNGSGAVNTTVQTKLRDYVSVKDFGAIADGDGAGGGTNNSTAIQAALDAILATGKSGVLHIPAGTYRCDTGLSVDASVVRIEADGALLDFTNLTSGTAITIGGGTLGYAGNPFLNAYSVIQGLKLMGNGYGGSVNGVRFYDSALNSGAHSKMRDCAIWNFGTGISIEDNSYLLSFDHVEVFVCGTCLSVPHTSNSGERITFTSCAFYNSTNGLALENANADYAFFGCTIDGMSDFYVYVSQGQAAFYGCHFEGSFGTGYSSNTRWVWVPVEGGGSETWLSFNDCTFLVKQAQGGDTLAVPVFGLYGNCVVSIEGGQVQISGATPTPTYIIDAPTGVVDLTVLRTYFVHNTTIYGPLASNTNCSYLLDEYGATSIKTSKGIQYPAVSPASSGTVGSRVMSVYEEQNTFTPTVYGSTGSAGTGTTYTTQTGYYQRIGKYVFYTINVVWTGVGSWTGKLRVGGLPFTAAGVDAAAISYSSAIAPGAGKELGGVTIASSTEFLFTAQDPSGAGAATQVNLPATGSLNMTGLYRVA